MNRAHVAALQRLLEGPQAVAARHDAGAGIDDEQRIEREADLREGRRRQAGRRVEHHDRATVALRLQQRRRQETQLADAGVRQQQLAQATPRPAATWQLAVERREAAGDGIVTAAAELVAEPQGRMQRLRTAHVDRLRPAFDSATVRR